MVCSAARLADWEARLANWEVMKAVIAGRGAPWATFSGVRRAGAFLFLAASVEEEDSDEGYDGTMGYMRSFDRRDDDVTEDPAGLSYLASGGPG